MPAVGPAAAQSAAAAPGSGLGEALGYAGIWGSWGLSENLGLLGGLWGSLGMKGFWGAWGVWEIWAPSSLYLGVCGRVLGVFGGIWLGFRAAEAEVCQASVMMVQGFKGLGPLGHS